MASYFLRAGSKYFQIKKKVRGAWVTEPTRITKDTPNYLRKLKKLKAEAEVIENAGETSRHGWEWVPEFIDKRYGIKTIDRYTVAWSALLVWFDEVNIGGPEDVTYQLARSYPEWRTTIDPRIMRPCKWNTALTELKVLSAIMQESVARGYIPANPCYRLGIKRRDVKKKPEITPDTQKKIEDELAKPSTPEWMRRSWAIAMSQGFRLSETAVPIANIDMTKRKGLPNGSIWIRGKGGNIHVAPLHKVVKEIAERTIKEGGATLVELPKSPAKEWWNFFRRLELEISFHSTRVSVVTRLARGGFSKAQTMAYVGHASETVHDVYTRLGAADVSRLGRSLAVGVLLPEKTEDSPSAIQEPTEQ